MYKALTKGSSFKTMLGNVLTLSPPLVVTREEVELAFSILDESLTEMALD